MTKLILYGLAGILALVLVARMMTSTSPATGDADTAALVSQLIENDPLISPLQSR